MRPILLALLLTLGRLAAYGQSPDCQFTQTFTATGYGVTVSNQAVANLGTQCTTWRLSYYADGMTALSIQIEGAPDANGSAGTFAAVPTTACSSTQQPPCLLDGANPLTDPNHATEAFRGYYAWIALDVTVFTTTGTGTITARMYGYKGTSSASATGGGGGSGITALTGDVTATGPGSAAATVVAINGGSVPASAHVLGTDASSQPIAATATDLSTIMYVAGGGIAQAQTVTLAPAVTALTNGLAVCWLPVAANSAAAPTLAVNATAAKPITKLGTTALVANDLTATAVACAIYDGTEFQLQNPQTASGLTALTGDVTATGPGSAAASVVKVNGASVPASAHVLGTNASSQPIASTATDLSALNYVAGGGIAQAQTVTLVPAVTALTNGLAVCWLPTAANSGAAPTLAVNATAAQPITKLGTTALVANDLTATAVACAIYDGTEFQLQNPQTVPASGITALTGDVTASGSGSVAATIAAAHVAPAMMKASTLDSQVDSGTVTWAIASVLNAQATLTFTVHTGSRTLNITNPVVGGNYVLKLIQDATGGVGLILGTGCTWKVVNGGAGVVTLTNAPNALDVLTFIYDGTNCLTTLLYNLS